VKNVIKLILLGSLVGMLAACGGSNDITCDDVQYYQLAEEGKRVEAPEDLDDLDPLREMALPEASPREPREAGSPCFDRPPGISLES
jgi:uncharacterized lipoprotein